MLTKLWRFLFGGCEHKWVEQARYGVYPIGRKDDQGPGNILIELKCEKCGTIKSKRLY